MSVERESIDFDVVFVGGGPASLAGAVQLMQLAREKNISIEVALIEKGADIGAHSVSGAILNPRALHELMPDHLERGCPVEAVVQGDAFYYLTRNRALRAFRLHAIHAQQGLLYHQPVQIIQMDG